VLTGVQIAGQQQSAWTLQVRSGAWYWQQSVRRNPISRHWPKWGQRENRSV